MSKATLELRRPAKIKEAGLVGESSNSSSKPGRLSSLFQTTVTKLVAEEHGYDRRVARLTSSLDYMYQVQHKELFALLCCQLGMLVSVGAATHACERNGLPSTACLGLSVCSCTAPRLPVSLGD